MVILGIDPGLRLSGYGIMERNQKNARLLDYGYLPLNPQKTLAERISLFYSFFAEKIDTYGVTNIALETPFLGKNAQNFLKLGYLRGILYLLSEQKKTSLHEFSPRQVKQAVTGFGGAQKDQVARAILLLLPSLTLPEKYDVTDALAVMLCGMWQIQGQ